VSNSEEIHVVVLISGSGTNLQALMDAIATRNIPAKLQAVISSNPNAYGLQRAARANIATETLIPQDYDNRQAYDLALAKEVAKYKPDLIVLAGFMRILSESFLNCFENKIINIHPSLLPKYPGLHTHQQALAQEEQDHGCSIHFVTNDLDSGPLIAQASVKIDRADTVDSLKQKVHQAEYFLYPTVLHWFAKRRIVVTNHRVFMDGMAVPPSGLQFGVLV
jgi:phosphoribosylglycinamide formyltransferase-1